MFLTPTENICCLDEQERHEKQKTLWDSSVACQTKTLF